MAWLLRSEGQAVLVDTGPADPDWSAKHHRPMSRRADEYLVPALAGQGVAPGAIRHVVLTHLHWDHCWGCTDVPEARIYVQREEMRYAAAPWPADAGPYETAAGCVLMARFYDRIVPVDGDRELLPGLRLLLTPGHTPGSQSVAVDTREGVRIIAGDLVGLGEALQSDPPHLPGIYHNVSDCYASFRKLLALSPHILPGHDPALFSSGAGAGGSEKASGT